VYEILVLYLQLVHMSIRVLSKDEVNQYICPAALGRVFEAILHPHNLDLREVPHTYFVYRVSDQGVPCRFSISQSSSSKLTVSWEIEELRALTKKGSTGAYTFLLPGAAVIGIRARIFG
jgi:hypothetical protein